MTGTGAAVIGSYENIMAGSVHQAVVLLLPAGLCRLRNGEKIAAVNLSLGSPIGDQQSQNVECGYINQIIAYGTAVVTAAGNKDSHMPISLSDSTSRSSIVSFFSRLVKSATAACVWASATERCGEWLASAEAAQRKCSWLRGAKLACGGQADWLLLLSTCFLV